MEQPSEITVHVYLSKNMKENEKHKFLIGIEVLGNEYYYTCDKGILKKNPGEAVGDFEPAFKKASDGTKKKQNEIDQLIEESKNTHKIVEEYSAELELSFVTSFYRSLSGKELDFEKLLVTLLKSEKFEEAYQQFEQQLRKTNETKYVDVKFEPLKTVCLNERSDRRVSNLFDGKEDTYLESDCDEQLLIFIPLDQKTKVKQLIVNCFGDNSTAKTLKIFKNKKDLDFDSLDDFKPTSVITVQKKDGDQVFDLDFVSFQDCHFLTIFVENNYGNDSTKIKKLRLIGEGLLTVKNLDGLKCEHN